MKMLDRTVDVLFMIDIFLNFITGKWVEQDEEGVVRSRPRTLPRVSQPGATLRIPRYNRISLHNLMAIAHHWRHPKPAIWVFTRPAGARVRHGRNCQNVRQSPTSLTRSLIRRKRWSHAAPQPHGRLGAEFSPFSPPCDPKPALKRSSHSDGMTRGLKPGVKPGVKSGPLGGPV